MYIMPKAAFALTDHYAPKVRKRMSMGKVKIILDRMEKQSATIKCRSIYLRTAFINNDSSHLHHSCAIKVFGTSTNPKDYMMKENSRLWVHCHCPYFFWYCEQALVMVKASSWYGINDDGHKVDPSKRGKGKVIRNPNLTPYICKHLYAGMLTLIRLEQGKTKYNPFKNKLNPYDGDYEDKWPAALER